MQRKLLGILSYSDRNGASFPVKVYLSSRRTRSIRASVSHGETFLVVPGKARTEDLIAFLDRVVRLRKGSFFDRPFYREGEYLFLLGRKRTLTQDPSRKGDESFFYYPPNARSPLARYRRMFLSYISRRLVEIGREYDFDLSEYRIGTGCFDSYYGCCYRTKKKFKFDIRLFAYRKEILDSVLYHEVTHLLVPGHGDRFYAILRLHCPDYDRLTKLLRSGAFQREQDEEND